MDNKEAFSAWIKFGFVARFLYSTMLFVAGSYFWLSFEQTLREMDFGIGAAVIAGSQLLMSLICSGAAFGTLREMFKG